MVHYKRQLDVALLSRKACWRVE